MMHDATSASTIGSKPAQRTVSAWLMLLALCLCLQACGFQLRGSADLPEIMDNTYLDMPDRYGEFGRALERTLTGNGITIQDSRQDASAVLKVTTARFQRTAASFAGTARIREYRLSFIVDFQVQSPSGESLSNSRHVQIFRDYSFDEQEILAATREEEFLRRNMEAAMVSEVLRRLEELPIRQPRQTAG